MRFARFLKGFRYAAQGICRAVREERNMRFHLCAAAYVYIFSLFYSFSRTQYILITLMVCGVLALELVNSSLERAVDNPPPERYQLAGAVKDMAAGAVLVYCIGCAVGGVLLFWDVPTLCRIAAFFVQHPAASGALVLSLIAACWFIFFKGDK
jgi:diacylglycerol kinase